MPLNYSEFLYIIMETKCIWTLDTSVAEQPAENILQNPYYYNTVGMLAPCEKYFKKRYNYVLSTKWSLTQMNPLKKISSHFVRFN